MEIVAVTTVWQGAFSAAEKDDLEGLRTRIKQWAGWAQPFQGDSNLLIVRDLW
jgi:hypothetical protein